MAFSQFIALDFGAGSGRAILGSVGDTIRLQEVHRFPNLQIKAGNHVHWDVLRLMHESKTGLSNAAKEASGPIAGLAIDTWGVDFGLLDASGQLIGNPVCYRDARTDGMMERAFQLLNKASIYKITGIQFMQLNSIFQLLSLVEAKSPQLEIAKQLLFMPDLFNYFLTGQVKTEYTFASTSQLLNANTRQWDEDLFQKLNLPLSIMTEIEAPGTVRGKLLKEIANETGLGEVDVIATASHDTASAVAAVPAEGENWAYLSSGTWSLIGIESDDPIITEDSLKYNFTNEGATGGKIRFLRNVMGMWLFESCIKVWEKQGKSFSYKELDAMAEAATPFGSIINPDDSSFLNPPDMVAAIQKYCQDHEQKIPETEGEIVRTIYESLAFRYRWVLDKIEEMQGKKIQTLHIVGGGSKNKPLNGYTANATGCKIIAGPVEATAIGNILVQAVCKGVISSIDEGRQLIARSFPVEEFIPDNASVWDDKYQEIRTLLD